MTSDALDVIDYKEGSVFSARDVESGYGDLKILEGVDIDVREDEIVLIFGPNGAGKSTFLKTLYGLLSAWNGTIEFKGNEITDVPAEDMMDYNICYVPQRDNAFDTLTIDENLDIGGIYCEDPSRRKEEVLEQFPDLRDKRKAKAGTLSGGQRQMLAMSRALMPNPDMVLIDEPSAGMAPKIVKQVFDRIREINDEGTAILMVEQNIKEGLELADRGYAMHNGQNAYEGPAKDLLESEQIRDLYMGG